MKIFVAFWDLFFYILISVPATIVGLYIMFMDTDAPNLFLSLLFGFSLGIPLGLILFLQHIKIDLRRNLMDAYYMASWGPKNNLDLKYNWSVFPSEIERISVVNLSKEEKKKYTSSKFLLKKYLKIELKYGAVKYVYVAHYANFQIQKIMKLLTENHIE